MKSAVRSPAFRRKGLASRNGFASDACGLKAGLLTDFLRSPMLEKFNFESFRSSRWFKPALAVVGAIALLVVILLVAPTLNDINTYRGQIVTQLERRLGRSVKLGAMRLSALPTIRMEVDD